MLLLILCIVFFYLKDDSCQYWLNLKNKTLTSPYYPKHYFADYIGCKWLITAPEQHIIALEFEDVEVSFKVVKMLPGPNGRTYYHIFIIRLYSNKIFTYLDE